jgi:hypothetical protein
MAKGIQDIGNGFGYLYMTDVAGTQIVATQPNTLSGVRNMRQQGTSTAPIVASRPAVGTITVNSVAGIGSITAITILGGNQLGATINVTSAVASVVAGQIAAAINAYTAAPVNFTAQAVNDVVYVFSPANAQPGYTTYNGATITVTVTSPTIQTTTTNTTNGSTQFGESYDDVFGYRFWLNADYGPTGVSGSLPASPTSLLYTIEVTDYFTVRGLQSGIVTLDTAIVSDRISGITRKCAITQLIVDTQGGAANDTLAFIQTEGFVEGDEIRLRGSNPVNTIRVEDATNSTSTIAYKNIYLINKIPFEVNGYLSINLQLYNDASLGFVWVETGRSQVANGVIKRTKLTIYNDIQNGLINPNALYQITNLGDGGTFVKGIATNEIDAVGTMLRAVPKSYADTWRPNMSVPVIGTNVRYYQIVYQNLTGAIGSPPNTDPVNWLPISKTDTNYYEIQAHAVGIDSKNITTWPITWERDNHNNFISQSLYALFLGDAYETFLWTLSSLTTCSGNTVIDGLFDCANSMGTVIDNTVISGAKFYDNYLSSGSDVSNNYLLNNSTIYDNYIIAIQGNTLNGGSINNNGTSTKDFGTIAGCNLQGQIVNCTAGLIGNGAIITCTVDIGGEINNCVFQGGAIRYTKIGTYSKIFNSSFSLLTTLSNVEACEITGSSVVQIADTGGCLYQCKINTSNFILDNNTQFTAGLNIYGSTINMVANSASQNSSITNCTLTFTGNFFSADLSSIYTAFTPTIAFSGFVSATGSSMSAILDLDNIAVYNAGTLTINNDLQSCGIFYLQTVAVGPINITDIIGLPTQFEVQFINISGGPIVTFTTTPVATIVANEIAGSAASYSLTGYLGGFDALWMNKQLGNVITKATILI